MVAMAAAMVVMIVVLLRRQLRQLTVFLPLLFVFLGCLPIVFIQMRANEKFQFANTVYTIKYNIREKKWKKKKKKYEQ